MTVWVVERAECGSNGKCTAFEECDRNVAWVVGLWAVEHREGTCAKVRWQGEQVGESLERGICGRHVA